MQLVPLQKWNVKLIVASPSKWHGNVKPFYTLINMHASPARLMVMGRTDMNCGKKGRPATIMPEYVRVNNEMKALVDGRRAAVGRCKLNSVDP
jgi:hypothetical protein